MERKLKIWKEIFPKSTTIWKLCKAPKRPANAISYTGRTKPNGEKIISSKYWVGYDKRGWYIIRQSGHWSRIITCKNSDGKEIPHYSQEVKQTICGKMRSSYWLLTHNDINRCETTAKTYDIIIQNL
ncbi:MAG: hypothetical protein LBP53_09070 [Candidatus Peribacteria bacterium]|nr:hypothetical protein [Candidatus Peribacteria bacterium]